MKSILANIVAHIATDRMKQTRANQQKWIRLALVAMLALAMLAACDNSEREATATPADAGAAGVGVSASGASAPASDSSVAVPAATPTPFTPAGNVVLWHSWAGADGDALTEILTRLRSEAPNLGVETLYVSPNDLPQAYADAVLAGGGPDLAVTQNWWMGDLLDAGVVRPLTPYMHPDLAAEYWQAALANFQRNGTVYGLPASFETVSLFQNRALASAGQAPATTDALLAMSSQPDSTLGVGLYANLYHVWWGFPAYGASLFDDNGKVILDQSQGSAQFLDWIKALSASGGSFVDSDYGMLMDRFKKGEFAWFVDGPWAISELREALGENLEVVPLPAGPSGAAQPWASAEGVILNPAVTEQQALNAYWLATRLTDAAAGSTFAALAGSLPANQRATLPDDPVLRGFATQAATAQPAPTQKEMDSVWGYGGDMLIKVLAGSVDAAAAVQEASALINEETGK